MIGFLLVVEYDFSEVHLLVIAAICHLQIMYPLNLSSIMALDERSRRLGLRIDFASLSALWFD